MKKLLLLLGITSFSFAVIQQKEVSEQFVLDAFTQTQYPDSAACYVELNQLGDINITESGFTCNSYNFTVAGESGGVCEIGGSGGGGAIFRLYGTALPSSPDVGQEFTLTSSFNEPFSFSASGSWDIVDIPNPTIIVGADGGGLAVYNNQFYYATYENMYRSASLTDGTWTRINSELTGYNVANAVGMDVYNNRAYVLNLSSLTSGKKIHRSPENLAAGTWDRFTLHPNNTNYVDISVYKDKFYVMDDVDDLIYVSNNITDLNPTWTTIAIPDPAENEADGISVINDRIFLLVRRRINNFTHIPVIYVSNDLTPSSASDWRSFQPTTIHSSFREPKNLYVSNNRVYTIGDRAGEDIWVASKPISLGSIFEAGKYRYGLSGWLDTTPWNVSNTGGGGTAPTAANVYPLLNSILQAGSNVTFATDDANNTITIASTATGGGGGTAPTAANIYPLLNSILQAGSNITFTTDDSNNMITIASTASGGGGTAPAVYGTSLPSSPDIGQEFTLTSQYTEDFSFDPDGEWDTVATTGISNPSAISIRDGKIYIGNTGGLIYRSENLESGPFTEVSITSRTFETVLGLAFSGNRVFVVGDPVGSNEMFLWRSSANFNESWDKISLHSDNENIIDISIYDDQIYILDNTDTKIYVGDDINADNIIWSSIDLPSGVTGYRGLEVRAGRIYLMVQKTINNNSNARSLYVSNDLSPTAVGDWEVFDLGPNIPTRSNSQDISIFNNRIYSISQANTYFVSSKNIQLNNVFAAGKYRYALSGWIASTPWTVSSEIYPLLKTAIQAGSNTTVTADDNAMTLTLASSVNLMTGTGTPVDSQGSNGDFYIDSNNGILYVKNAGAWRELNHSDLSNIIKNGLELPNCGDTRRDATLSFGVGATYRGWSLDSTGWNEGELGSLSITPNAALSEIIGSNSGGTFITFKDGSDDFANSLSHFVIGDNEYPLADLGRGGANQSFRYIRESSSTLTQSFDIPITSSLKWSAAPLGTTLDFNLKKSDGTYVFEASRCSVGELFVRNSHNSRSLWYYAGPETALSPPERDVSSDISMSVAGFNVPDYTTFNRTSNNIFLNIDDNGNILIPYISSSVTSTSPSHERTPTMNIKFRFVDITTKTRITDNVYQGNFAAGDFSLYAGKGGYVEDGDYYAPTAITVAGSAANTAITISSVSAVIKNIDLVSGSVGTDINYSSLLETLLESSNAVTTLNEEVPRSTFSSTSLSAQPYGVIKIKERNEMVVWGGFFAWVGSTNYRIEWMIKMDISNPAAPTVISSRVAQDEDNNVFEHHLIEPPLIHFSGNKYIFVRDFNIYLFDVSTLEREDTNYNIPVTDVQVDTEGSAANRLAGIAYLNNKLYVRPVGSFVANGSAETIRTNIIFAFNFGGGGWTKVSDNFQYPSAYRALQGSGIPNSNLGVNGNFYWDTTNRLMYIKVNGSWLKTSSISGNALTTSTTATATITPSSANAKILLLVNGDVTATGSNAGSLAYKITRTISGTTADVSGSTAEFNNVSNSGSNVSVKFPVSINYIDEPNTTAEITYTAVGLNVTSIQAIEL